MNPILEQMLRGIEGQKIASYRLDKFIGIGGFGGVFKASEMVRNTPVKEVALKIIPESSDQQLQELLTARELEHPYLVRSYSVGECQFFNIEMLYLVMELANGSLDKHIKKGKLSTDAVKSISQQVANGLKFLHDHSRVHRDLKPANILSVNQQWKLSDFGLIRQLNNNTHTQTMNTAGTIVYMPPEAFEGEISPAWDMWSLGIMLVEILTNELPYHFDNDINKLMGKVMKGDLQIPSLPSEFKPIVQGCLQKERRLRWTAQQVLDALHGSQSSFVIINSPTSPRKNESPITSLSEESAQVLTSPKNEEKSFLNFFRKEKKSPLNFFGTGRISLRSEKNINYKPLESLLSQQRWEQADEKTADLMLQVMGKGSWLDVYSNELLKFPKTDLRTIDQLWLKYSNGKFGFSVQKQIWLNCGGKIGKYDYSVYCEFGDKVGWRETRGFYDNWLGRNSMIFNMNAPQAHLPCLFWGLRGGKGLKWRSKSYGVENLFSLL